MSDAEYAALNLIVGTDRICLNAAVTFDAAKATTSNFFSLDTNAAQSITNLAKGSTVLAPLAHAANITTAGAVGVTELTFIIGSTATTGLTLGG